MNAVVRGNLSGIGALVMWSTMVGLIRSITEAFGVAAGTALIYSIGAVAILLKNGVPDVRRMPKAYLFGAGAVFVAYEIVYSQGLGRAENARQTLEVSMINYLWPCLTVVFSVWINKTRLHWWAWPGTAIAVAGIYWCVAANGGGDFYGFISNLRANPIPYLFGAAAGITWALYSNLSFRFSGGFNGVPLFFAVIAAVLWTNFFLGGGVLQFPGLWPVCQLLIIGAVMGFSYSMWESGIHHGNFVLLAVCSYFTPAATMLFGGVWLGALPPPEFWAGVGLVIGGSMLCWMASLKKR